MDEKLNTLRLIMPQWQGGALEAYHFGAKLLDMIVPAEKSNVATVTVSEPDGAELPLEDGIIAKSALLSQADSAAKILNENKPNKLLILGGDCLVDLMPFAYLNEKYDGDLAILWVDSHPDILTKEHYSHAHAMVLANLMGIGDKDFTDRVPLPIKPSNIMYAGLYDMMPVERAFLDKHQIGWATPNELAETSQPILDWFKSTGAKHLAVHLDLDVLNPAIFRSLYFSNPKDTAETFASIPQGRMLMTEVTRLLSDVSEVAEIVGLGIAEHLPWDTIALKKMLEKLPLIREGI